jgi:hypothetical protein
MIVGSKSHRVSVFVQARYITGKDNTLADAKRYAKTILFGPE